ncbi:MAG: helix-turn-helix domain-containing protein, partial [Methanobacteriota archaeon]
MGACRVAFCVASMLVLVTGAASAANLQINRNPVSVAPDLSPRDDPSTVHVTVTGAASTGRDDPARRVTTQVEEEVPHLPVTARVDVARNVQASAVPRSDSVSLRGSLDGAWASGRALAVHAGKTPTGRSLGQSGADPVAAMDLAHDRLWPFIPDVAVSIPSVHATVAPARSASASDGSPRLAAAVSSSPDDFARRDGAAAPLSVETSGETATAASTTGHDPLRGRGGAPDAAASFASLATTPASSEAGGLLVRIAAALAVAVFALPLLRRMLDRAKVLSSSLRKRMLGAIEARPGMTMSEVAAATGIGVSHANYHLDTLAEFGFLARVK